MLYFEPPDFFLLPERLFSLLLGEEVRVRDVMRDDYYYLRHVCNHATQIQNGSIACIFVLFSQFSRIYRRFSLKAMRQGQAADAV